MIAKEKKDLMARLDAQSERIPAWLRCTREQALFLARHYAPKLKSHQRADLEKTINNLAYDFAIFVIASHAATGEWLFDTIRGEKTLCN